MHYIPEQRLAMHHFFRLLLGGIIVCIAHIFAEMVPYARQGFFCDDDEIRYPRYKDTITESFMSITFFFSTVFLILTVEYSLIRHLTVKRNHRLSRNHSAIHQGLYNIAYFIMAQILNKFAVGTVTSLGKRTVSRLRPNFLSICQPNLTELCPTGSHNYIDNYTCTGSIFEDEYFSFPSGHSAYSTAYSVFLIYYLYKRCKFPEPLQSLLQFVLAVYTYFICLSRVRDHKHRMSDVMGGVFVGFTTSLFLVHFVLQGFKLNRYKTEEISAGTAVPSTVIIEGGNYSKQITKENKSKQNETQNKLMTSEYGSISD